MATAVTPDIVRDHNLNDLEYERILEILGIHGLSVLGERAL